MSKTGTGNFFEDFRIGQMIRHATPRTVTRGRRRALHRAVRGALRRAVLGRIRAVDRLPARAGRRSPGVPHRVRQDRARHLAQRGRQSRLCGLPVPRPGLSGRHAQRGVGGDRAQGEFQPQDRDRVRALDRLQAGRRQGARICALGDGAKARRGGAGARRPRAAPARGGAAEHAGRRLPADRSPAPTTSRSPAARTGSATTRSARRSTTSTASPSRRPSTRSPPGSTRTRRASISTSSPPRRAASGGG